MQNAQKPEGVTKSVAKWKKYEYFNFPVPETNDLFDQLQKHFAML